MNGKKDISVSCYSRIFIWKALFSIFSWTIFAVFFLGLGKKCLETDILGKIYNSVSSEKRSFNQYFLGGSKIAEKSKILNYAFFFFIAIIALNFIVLQVNKYLWEKDKYIENNRFYLHDKWIFIINSLIHVACACLLTSSFVSIFTVILVLLFVSFNSWELFPQQRKLRNLQTESFFSWKNQYIRKITIYSTIVIFIVPLVIGRFRTFHQNALTVSPEGFAKVYQEMINRSDFMKSLVELIIQANYNLFHWFILLWFVRGIIKNRLEEFANFWANVNSIEKKITNFKHYYYYQESWALANNNLINLGDYNYLESNPNFLKKEYLEGDLDIEDFAKRIHEVIRYIEFCDNKIKAPPKRNFLNWCLFNEFNSWEDCLKTKKLINVQIRKKSFLI